jgi:Tol biopolymer transport system component
MMWRRVGLCGLSCLLLASSIDAQQVVFSRRVYAARGTTYQQLWMWSAPNGRLIQLTRSARDHENPVCSPDGTQIFFDSGTDPLAQRHWRFDRETGTEQRMSGAPPLTEIAGPDTLNLHVPGCDDRTWSQAPDGSRVACAANGEDLVIVDVIARKELDRIRFDQRNSTGALYPRWPLRSTWSPDGRTLLVGTYGEYGSSTSSQLDFFLLDLPAKTWTRAMTGNNPVWLPNGDAIIFETPRDLVPLPPSGRRSVWSGHLARFDLATRTETRLTSGVTNNVQPTLCGR